MQHEIVSDEQSLRTQSVPLGFGKRRTLRSKKHRAALWRMTDGKCAICGCDLPDSWHADHIVAWVKCNRTNVHEMQPACRNCNLKKGSN